MLTIHAKALAEIKCPVSFSNVVTFCCAYHSQNKLQQIEIC